MEVPLTADQLSHLAEVAEAKGRTVDALAQEVLTRYLEEEARFEQAVKIGEAQLDRGAYLTHDQVAQRVKQLFQS
jgi:predicted transcriptional regulator